MIALEGIDHIALGVRDVGRSAAWYQEVLGMERRYEEAWGDFPAVVGVGTTSLALFPIVGDAAKPPPGRDTVAMRHVAFRTSRTGFRRACEELERRGIAYESQHHEIAESIYFPDPDGHQLEITTYEL